MQQITSPPKFYPINGLVAYNYNAWSPILLASGRSRRSYPSAGDKGYGGGKDYGGKGGGKGRHRTGLKTRRNLIVFDKCDI